MREEVSVADGELVEVIDYPQYTYESVESSAHVLLPRQSYPSTDNLDRGIVDEADAKSCFESVAVIAGPNAVSLPQSLKIHSHLAQNVSAHIEGPRSTLTSGYRCGIAVAYESVTYDDGVTGAAEVSHSIDLCIESVVNRALIDRDEFRSHSRLPIRLLECYLRRVSVSFGSVLRRRHGGGESTHLTTTLRRQLPPSYQPCAHSTLATCLGTCRRRCAPNDYCE